MSGYFPLNYQKINIQNGTHSPVTPKNRNNRAFWFWQRALYQRACSILDITVPEEWEGDVKDFLYYCLFRFGYVTISKDAVHGQYFQPCTLNGRNFYYQPVNCIISNPDLSATLKIGTECQLLRLTPDFLGVFDIIDYYAEKLSLLDNAINMSLINSKFAFLLAARNKQAAAALKKMLDLVNQGEPAVVVDMKLLNDPTDKSEPWQFLDLGKNLKSTYLTTDQLRDAQTLLNNYDCEIGIPTIPYQKAERMVQSEAESRIVDSTSRSVVWLKTMESSIKQVKKLYPDITLDVKLRFDPEEMRKEEQVNERREDNSNRYAGMGQ